MTVLLVGFGSGTVWVRDTVRVIVSPLVGTMETPIGATQREGSGPLHANDESDVRAHVQFPLPTTTVVMTPPATEIVSLVEEGSGFGPPLEPLTRTTVGCPFSKVGDVKMLA